MSKPATIPTEVYNNLSPSSRIRAAISAIARDDTDELETLKDTCIKKSYLITDPAYSEAIQRLLTLALAVEANLQSAALDFLFAVRLKQYDIIDDARATAVALEAAWQALLDELGIPREEMDKAGPGRHYGVEIFLTVSKRELDPAAVQDCLKDMRAWMDTAT